MAALLARMRWRYRMIRLGFTLKPIQGGDGSDPDPKPDPKPDPDPTPDPDPKPDPDPDEPIKPEDDWQAKARKHERDLKKERKVREETERKLKEREDADKSEQEKAIEAARDEARKEAMAEADKERRADRLESAVTRLALRGIERGEGDDAKTIKFADSEDALLRVERAISRGDIDVEEIYDSEGKVNTDALTTALGEILERNPHLAANGSGPPPPGDPDTRKGTPAPSDLEAMTPADHEKRKYATK